MFQYYWNGGKLYFVEESLWLHAGLVLIRSNAIVFCKDRLCCFSIFVSNFCGTIKNDVFALTGYGCSNAEHLDTTESKQCHGEHVHKPTFTEHTEHRTGKMQKQRNRFR